MSFVRNPELDEIREKYKQEYNETFHYIQMTPKTKEFRFVLKPLHIRERQLQERTKKFLSENRYYFTQKRMYLFDQLEKRGLFGTMPVFEEVEPEGYRTGAKLRRIVHKEKFCVECGAKFMWYEARPSEMCRKCKNIQPVGI